MFFCCVPPFLEVVFSLAGIGGVFIQCKEQQYALTGQLAVGVTVCFLGERVQYD